MKWWILQKYNIMLQNLWQKNAQNNDYWPPWKPEHTDNAQTFLPTNAAVSQIITIWFKSAGSIPLQDTTVNLFIISSFHMYPNTTCILLITKHNNQIINIRLKILLTLSIKLLFSVVIRISINRAHDNSRTSDILRTFTLISGQLVTWPEYMSALPVWRIQLPLSQAFC